MSNCIPILQCSTRVGYGVTVWYPVSICAVGRYYTGNSEDNCYVIHHPIHVLCSKQNMMIYFNIKKSINYQNLQMIPKPDNRYLWIRILSLKNECFIFISLKTINFKVKAYQYKCKILELWSTRHSTTQRSKYMIHKCIWWTILLFNIVFAIYNLIKHTRHKSRFVRLQFCLRKNHQ